MGFHSFKFPILTVVFHWLFCISKVQELSSFTRLSWDFANDRNMILSSLGYNGAEWGGKLHS